MYNRKTFFNKARGIFYGSLTQKQVDGLNLLLDEAEARQTPINDLAYILATVRHETASTMQPIEEYGRGGGRKYGRPDPQTKQTYYGRGYVQLTWKYNYEKAKDKLGVDFVNYPDLVMEPEHALHILFVGMEKGWFTGKELDDYIVDDDEGDYLEYRNARYIINGRDKRDTIAKVAVKFEKALRAAKVVNPKPLLKSRTVGGGAVVGAAGLAKAAESVQEVVQVVEQNKAGLESGTIVGIVVASLAILGACLVLYARWDDAGRTFS